MPTAAETGSITIEDATLARLRSEHGDVLHLETDWGDAVFKVATPELWQRFNDEIADEQMRGRALRALVYGCRVYPDLPEFERLMRSRPGLIQGFGNEIVTFCGLGRAAVRKK